MVRRAKFNKSISLILNALRERRRQNDRRRPPAIQPTDEEFLANLHSESDQDKANFSCYLSTKDKMKLVITKLYDTNELPTEEKHQLRIFSLLDTLWYSLYAYAEFIHPSIHPKLQLGTQLAEEKNYTAKIKQKHSTKICSMFDCESISASSRLFASLREMFTQNDLQTKRG